MAVRVRGLREVIKRLNDVVFDVRRDVKRDLYIAAELIRNRSQNNTPVDTGNLRASHYVVADTRDTRDIVEVGVTASYGIAVHENLEARHTTGEAKFLERAVAESEADIIRLLQSGIL